VSRAYAPLLVEIRLVPASGGTFDVLLDDEVVFSKSAAGRHAGPGEVLGLLAARLGDAIDRG
jgi:predicted Rdx family selenoprotein